MTSTKLLLALSGVISGMGQSAPAGRARTLEALPGVQIQYYDVSGSSLPAINESILANAPRDPASRAHLVSASRWNIDVRFEQRFSQGKCEITAASAQMLGSVSLPRLVTPAALPGDQRHVWDRYISNLKSFETAKLWFVADRIPDIAAAVRRSSCKAANHAAALAAAKIDQELKTFERVNKKPAPTFIVPVRDPHWGPG